MKVKDFIKKEKDKNINLIVDDGDLDKVYLYTNLEDKELKKLFNEKEIKEIMYIVFGPYFDEPYTQMIVGD